MKKVCPTCLDTFEITKWQKSKIYCTEVCKPKSQKPPTGNPIGRPKAKKWSKGTKQSKLPTKKVKKKRGFWINRFNKFSKIDIKRIMY